jgi:hypothetical protein
MPAELTVEPDKETISDVKVYEQELAEYKKSLELVKQDDFGKMTYGTSSSNYRAQVSIEVEGVYFVSAEDVCDEIGETIASASMLFSTNGINFLNDGVQVAYQPHVLNGATGALFYAESIASPFAYKNIYVLEKSEGLLWQHDSSLSPTNSIADQVFENFIEVFCRSTSRADATDLMEYGTAFGNNTFSGLDETFDLPGLSDSNANVYVQLFESVMYPNPMTCVFQMNGADAHTANWSDVAKPVDISFSVSNVHSNDNVLSTTPISSIYKGFAFLKKYGIEYNRNMIADGEYLNVVSPPVDADVSTVSGFSSTNLYVLDVSDKKNPQIVDGLFYEGQSNEYSVSFYTANSSNSYVAFSGNASGINTEFEVSRELVSSVDLLAYTNKFNYIMIMPDSGYVTAAFMDALSELGTYRQTTGFSVLEVSITDIYNQFSYGVPNLYAIKDFLNYAYTNWSVGPKYVVLCGVGTFDYFDTVSGATKPNLIPPLMTFNDYDGMRACDSPFVDFNNDLRPDIPIGRLSFYTTEKVEAYVQKVKNYEKSGAWHGDIGLLCSRNEGVTSGNFPLQSDVVAREIPNDFMTINTLYQTTDEYNKGVDISSDAVEFLNSGYGIVNYFGHGAYYKFADQGGQLVLENADVSSIYNMSQPTLFLQLTCDTGRFSLPTKTSIAENLTGSTIGGAAASFACTASSIDKWNYELGQIMFDEIFNDGVPRIGDVVVSSLGKLTGVEPEYDYIFKTYNIFGDPALMIQYPSILSDVADGEGTVEPARFSLRYGDSAIVTNTPAEHYYIKNVIIDDQLLPPTNYVEFVNVTNSHNVLAVFEGEPTEFVVDSVYGSSNYGLGTNVAPYDSSLTCSVTNPSVYHPTENVRYVCIGWQGTGSVPATGIGSSVDFILTNETSISWVWSTQVLFQASIASNGTVNPASQWFDIGTTNVMIEAVPDDGYHFVSWTGDIPGGVSYDNPIYLTMDQPKNIEAAVDLYSITPTASSNGLIYPDTIQKYPTGATSGVFRIVSDEGCHISDVLVDGVSTGAVLNVIFNNIQSNHTVEAIFATNLVNTFSIQVLHNQLGYVDGLGSAYTVGSTATFSNIAFEHSHVGDVLIDGVSAGITNQYTFENITMNHQYNVVFEMDTNSVSVANGYGYCNLPDGETYFDYGSYINCFLNETEFTLPENGGIKLTNIGWANGFGNIPEYGTVSDVQFNLTDDSGLSWQWNTQYWFEASVNIEEAGYVSESSGWHDEGEMLYVTATPAEHYEFEKWIGDGIVPPQSTNSYIEIVMPAEPYDLEAVFVLESFDISTSVSDVNAGQISPFEASAFYGTNITFDISANEHYYVADVLVDGISVGATNEYTFEYVVTPHEISAVFATNSYNVVIDSPYDVTSPAVGTNAFVYSNLVDIVITNTLVYDQDILAKYSATGWVGSGSAPLSGSETNVSFYIEEDSAVRWLWHTNYYIDVGIVGSGYINATSSWMDIDSSLLVEATSTNDNYHFKGWLGDTNNCLINGQQITIPADMPRVVNAWFKTNVFIVTSTSVGGAGSISPQGDVDIPHSQNSPLYYMQPYENAHIEDLEIDGVSTNIVFEYIFMNVTNDHTITATFATNSTGYHSLLVVPPTTNGRVYASSYYFPAGSTVTVTNVADEHYHVSEIFVNGTNVAPVDILELNNIQSNQTVSVFFELDTNNVEMVDSYGHASLPEGDNWFDYNSQISVDITNAAIVFEGMTTQLFCYGWAGTGSVPVSGTGTNVAFALRENSSIQWLWNTQYMFVATTTTNGQVQSENGWFDPGSQVSATAVADYGYHFVSWDGNLPVEKKFDNPINMSISNAIAIEAIFEINQYPVVADYGLGGSIAPEGTNYVTHGSNITFDITPEEHYHIYDVVVDGASVGDVSSCTIYSVTNGLQISASFEIDEHTLTVDSLFGGETPSGVQSFDYGTFIECSVTNSPIIINTETQYLCVGWSAVADSVVTNGTGTNISFNIAVDTELTWIWETNYWVDIDVGTGLGTVDMTSGWYKADTLLSPTATPTNGYHLSYWSGDIYAWRQYFIMYYDTLNITNDYPRNLSANFALDNSNSSFYIPGATNVVSEFPAYLNDQDMYSFVHGALGSNGICFATATGDIMAYYDRNGYNNIPYWNLIKNGIAPLTQTEIYQSPGLNAADVAACITNVGYDYYVLYPDYEVAEREIIEDYSRTKPGLDFDVVYHRVADDEDEKEAYYNVIVDEINAGRPVVIGWYGGTFGGHYLPAIGYVIDGVNRMVYLGENRQDSSRRRYENFFGPGCGSLIMDTIIPQGTPKDIYESMDSSIMTNTAVRIHPDDIYDFRQTHCFDETNDVDWVKCSLNYGREYYFETQNLGMQGGTILELYTEGGQLIRKSPETGATQGSTSYIPYVAVSNHNVYLKVSPAQPDLFGYNSNYDLQTTFSNMFATLTVESQYGMTSLTNGSHEYLVGANVICSITNQTSYSSVTNATKYTFKNWLLSDIDGSISNNTASCEFVITKDSTLKWNWQTNHWLDLDRASHGHFDTIDSWIKNNSYITVNAAADQYYHLFNWVGDTNGLFTENNAIYGSVTSPLIISAVFAADLETGGTPDWWLASYGLTNDFAFEETYDYDGDLLTSGEEYITGTDPTDSNSLFCVTSLSVHTNGLNPYTILNWTYTNNRIYAVEKITNLLYEAVEITNNLPIGVYTDYYDSVDECLYYKINVRLDN